MVLMESNPLDPHRFVEAVAEVVETLRWECRITSARKLADAAGMTHTYLNLRLSGRKAFDVEDLARLSGVFGVGPDDIIDRAVAVASADSAAIAALDPTEVDQDPGAPEEWP